MTQLARRVKNKAPTGFIKTTMHAIFWHKIAAICNHDFFYSLSSPYSRDSSGGIEEVALSFR